MEVHSDIPLKNYTTMQLGGNARFMADIHSPEEAQSATQRATQQNLSIFILGGGSNVLAHDDGYNGIILRNRIMGIETIADTAQTTTLKIGAGEIWDEVVRYSVEQSLSGIEALSHIPGTAGAAPVQNIGAYGQEVADTLVSVDAYDRQSDTFVTLSSKECGFSYRHSIFRGSEAGRYIITAITLELYKSTPQPPFYKALEDYFTSHNVTIFSPQVVRDAVIAIRTNKLPDPKKLPNSGSFFKNAVIEQWQLDDLLKQYPDMPHYDMPNGAHKIPTGWLIEKTGLKGKTLNGIKVHDANALVLINESAQSFSDLDTARRTVAGAVRDKFRITIEQEPLEIV